MEDRRSDWHLHHHRHAVRPARSSRASRLLANGRAAHAVAGASLAHRLQLLSVERHGAQSPDHVDRRQVPVDFYDEPDVSARVRRVARAARFRGPRPRVCRIRERSRRVRRRVQQQRRDLRAARQRLGAVAGARVRSDVCHRCTRRRAQPRDAVLAGGRAREERRLVREAVGARVLPPAHRSQRLVPRRSEGGQRLSSHDSVRRSVTLT